jgi:hypothetical protein
VAREALRRVFRRSGLLCAHTLALFCFSSISVQAAGTSAMHGSKGGTARRLGTEKDEEETVVDGWAASKEGKTVSSPPRRGQRDREDDDSLEKRACLSTSRCSWGWRGVSARA